MIQITAEFQTFWQVSTGRGAGQNLDSLIERDSNGLPYVSGKTLKGLFREAFAKLAEWQEGEYQQYENELFGSFSQNSGRHETQQGKLHFSSLSFSQKEIEDFKHYSSLSNLLTTSHSSTKINEKTGVAEDKSLRSSEVVLPVVLTGEISLMDEDNSNIPNLIVLMQNASSLITHIGSKKNRGYGQVLFKLEEIKK